MTTGLSKFWPLPLLPLFVTGCGINVRTLDATWGTTSFIEASQASALQIERKAHTPAKQRSLLEDIIGEDNTDKDLRNGG